MPTQIKMKDKDLMVRDEEDEIMELSEELAFDWVNKYLMEVDHSNAFYETKLKELIEEFIQLQEKFRIRSQIYQDDKTAKKEKDAKKAKKEKL